MRTPTPAGSRQKGRNKVSHKVGLPPFRSRKGGAQIGRDLALCGTSGYIYWKSGRGAPVGARAGLGPTPTKETKPYRVYCKERSQNGASCVEGPLIRLGFAVPPFPIPSGLRPSPLDKGSRPPRGRLDGRPGVPPLREEDRREKFYDRSPEGTFRGDRAPPQRPRNRIYI